MTRTLAWAALTVIGLVACGQSNSSEGSKCEAGASGAAAHPDTTVGGDGSVDFPPLAGMVGEPSATSGGAAGEGLGGTGPQADAGAGGDIGDSQGGAAGLRQGGDGGAPELTAVDPGELAGLALWLEASSETCVRDAQEQVSLCADLSGNANHASQADAGLRPTLVSSALAARATLRFDDEPSSLVVADAPTLHFGEGDFTYLIVGRWRNATQANGQYAGAGAMLAKQNQFFPYAGVVLFANYQSLYGVAAMPRFAVQLALGGPLALSYSGTLNDDVFRLYVARRVGQDLELRIGGAFEARVRITEALSVDGVGVPLALGGWVGNQFRGDISEVVVIGGSVSDELLGRVELGLRDKYGLD